MFKRKQDVKNQTNLYVDVSHVQIRQGMKQRQSEKSIFRKIHFHPWFLVYQRGKVEKAISLILNWFSWYPVLCRLLTCRRRKSIGYKNHRQAKSNRHHDVVYARNEGLFVSHVLKSCGQPWHLHRFYRPVVFVHIHRLIHCQMVCPSLRSTKRTSKREKDRERAKCKQF